MGFERAEALVRRAPDERHGGRSVRSLPAALGQPTERAELAGVGVRADSPWSIRSTASAAIGARGGARKGGSVLQNAA